MVEFRGSGKQGEGMMKLVETMVRNYQGLSYSTLFTRPRITN